MWGTVLRRRYRIAEPIGHGGMGAVYRAYDRLTGEWVALKRIARKRSDDTVRAVATPPTEDDSDASTGASTGRSSGSEAVGTIAEGGHGATRLSARAAAHAPSPPTSTRFRLALAQEFRTLSSLNHPNIIRVLDYGFDAQQLPYFTMELLRAPQSFRQAGEGQPLDERVQLVAQLLRALAYLHRHGVLHRDLKPSNVLCESGIVKVLDFGVATHAAAIRDVAGTVDYMAPEVLLGAPPSAVSDLYAVGVMAYELWVGDYPFNRSEQSRLLADILGPEADRPLPAHVRRLLASTRSIQPTPETPESVTASEVTAQRENTRWSGLRALPPALRAYVRRLLSRDPLQRFPTAERALVGLSEAAGIALPIDTESTRESLLSAARLVGRDRELGALSDALEDVQSGRGGLILIAGESGVGKSRLMDEAQVMAMVRGIVVLRGQTAESGGTTYQVLQGALRSLCLYSELSDAEASVLMPLVPDLDTLLGRSVAEAPALDPQATQSRLRTTLEGLLLRQRNPTLLALEDLHSVDHESLALLQRVALDARTRPLLILASYRDDERPRLPAELPHARLLPIARLGSASIGQLCEQMLGDVARNPELLRLVERESEGNPFLIVEVARALADALPVSGPGQLEVLPSAVKTGGMSALIARRLAQVAPATLPTLRLAAVAGRTLDLAVLARVEPELSRWLRSCERAAVIVLRDGRWQFAHDKLREGVLAELSPADRRALHDRIAHAIEQTHEGAPWTAAALAFHFDAAAVPTQALRYARRAAEHALATGAIHDAIAHLLRAQTLLEQVVVEPLARAEVLRLLATALWSAGRIKDCVPVMEEAMVLLGAPLPGGTLELVRAFVRESWRVAQLQLQIGTREARPAGAMESEQLKLLRGASEAYFWVGDPGKALFVNLRALNLAAALGDDVARAQCSGVVGYCLDRAGAVRLGQHFFSSARLLIDGADPAPRLVYYRLLSALHMEHGRLQPALEANEHVIEIARLISDEPNFMFGTHIQACMCFVWADDEAAQASVATLLASAEHVGHALYRVWSRAVQGAIWLRKGLLDQARQVLDEAALLAQLEQDKVARSFLAAARARCLFHQGEPHAAWLLMRESVALASTIKFPSLMMLEIYSMLIDLGLRLDALGFLLGLPLAAMIRDNLSALHSMARRSEHWQARASIHQGVWDLQRGRGPLARRSLERGLRVAKQYGLRFDEALAHAALARYYAKHGSLARRDGASGTPAPDPAALHRQAAATIFEQIGARLHLDELPRPELRRAL